MRVTVVIQDKLVAKAKKMFRKKTLSGLLNSCLADWIAQMSKRQLEARLTEKYRRSKTGRRRVSRDFAAVDKQGWPSWWKEERKRIHKEADGERDHERETQMEARRPL